MPEMVELPDPIYQALYEGWQPPDVRPIAEWAEENIELPLTYAIPGPFNPQISRHIIPVWEALQDDCRRTINVLKATQTFGTGLVDIFVPWTIANAPGPILWTWHTDQMAAQHAEARAMPVIRGCRIIARLIPDNRHKNRNKEIIFKNGAPLYIQGPAPGNLQGKSIRYLLNDEVWQWPPGRLREAEARVAQYKKIGTSKILNISQGGEAGDDWHKCCFGKLENESPDVFEWEVPCPHCGKHQILVMEEEITVDNEKKKIYRMKWDKEGGNIFYECEHCLKPIYDSDETKAKFNAGGRYRQTRVGRDREVVTFRWTSLICMPWKDLVKDYRECLAAKKVGALLPLKAYLQKVMAMFWDQKEQIESVKVAIRYADYQPCKFPPGLEPKAEPKPVVIDATAEAESAALNIIIPWSDEKFRFLTVDCQANFLEFWAVIRAWGSSESRRLWRGKLESWEAIRQLQLEWNVRSQFVMVDSGYRASEVYRQCCRYVDETGRGWVALKGSPSEYFTHTFAASKNGPSRPQEKRIYSERQYGDPALGLRNAEVEKWLAGASPYALELYRKGKLKCPLYLWSNPSVKDITSNLRDGQGMPWLAPECDSRGVMENVYRTQMASEPKVLEHDSRGNEKYVYHQVGDNHLWDCENEQTVGAVIAGVIPLPRVA